MSQLSPERPKPEQAGRLPSKKCPAGCGVSVCPLPVAGTKQWIRLDPKPDQRLGEYVVERGEARRVRTGEPANAWRYIAHRCTPPVQGPSGVQGDLFGTTDATEPSEASTDPTAGSHAVYEPPIVGNNDPWTSKLAAERIEPTRGSKRAAVLDLLRSEDRWFDGPEILAVGGTEGLRRLRELRQSGWAIARRPHPWSPTSWQYRLALTESARELL